MKLIGLPMLALPLAAALRVVPASAPPHVSALQAVASLACAAIVLTGDAPATAAESRYLQQDVQAANDRVEISVRRYADLAHTVLEKARPEALEAYEASLLRLAPVRRQGGRRSHHRHRRS